MSEGLPRYLPEWPLPPYAYRPGTGAPHPTRDVRGHSVGAEVEPAAHAEGLAAPERWRECSAFLRAVDLYNHGYRWEAHEEWEGLWRAAPEGGVRALLQGLIQLAAAGLQWELGKRAGARRVASRALGHFGAVPGERLMGVDVRGLETAIGRWLGGQGEVPVIRLGE